MNALLRNFNRDFDALATLHGDRLALIPVLEGQRALTYSELDGLIDRQLRWMDGLGLHSGDRVGALMPNSLEMLIAFLACMRGGFQFAPLACDTSSAEAEKWVSLIRPARVIVGHILPEAVRAGLVAAKADAVEVVVDGQFRFLPASAANVSRGTDPKLFLYTSGTTGMPKAIVLDGNRLWSAGHAFAHHYGISADTGLRIWNYLPQSYLGGLFNLCLIPLSVGGSVVVDESFSGKTFLSFWQTVDRFDLNALWLVPTIVRGLVAIGERTRRNQAKSYHEAIKFAFLGTAPVELETKRKFEALFAIPLFENFALSETTFLTGETRADLLRRSEGSTGPVLPWVEFAVRPVAGGTEESYREILVKTPFMFDGYLGADGQVTLETTDGCFATGDLGFIDDAQQLIVTGRCKDIIKKGGQLVSLREIELVALAHPRVKNAAATPTPHSFYGESYRLFVQLDQGADPTVVNDVRSFIFERVAKYKWPDSVEAADAFPQTSSGKIRKFLLEDRGGS